MTDYVAMPFDAKQNTAEVPSGPSVDSSMTVGMRSHFVYNKMNSTAQQHPNMDSAVCLPDGADMHAQYTTLHDYEQYPTGYQSSSIYVSKSPALAAAVGRASGAVAPQCSYRSDLNACTIIGAQGQLVGGGMDDVGLGMPSEHDLGATVRYLQASQYDEMSEYGGGVTAASSCPVESHYADDPAVAYGYVSEANYGLPGDPVGPGGAVVQASAYASRPHLYDDNLNGGGVGVGGDALVMSADGSGRGGGGGIATYDSHADFQSKMSQLTLNPLDMVSQMRDAKDELMDGSGSDICSTMRWRDPNLSEVISFLNNPNNAIKANAAAYLQHLCYMDDPNKQRTRTLGGIPPLIHLLSYDIPDIHKNACGALRNLSYGRQNDENKRAIKNAGGITALVQLLCRTQESEVKELVTGVLWNMSSCEDIKRSIIDESLHVIVSNIIKPHSGWDPVCAGDTCFSTVFRNASGVLRNVSSAGEYARTRLRESEHLVECLLYVVRTAIEKNNIGNKTVENCVCILRNLSYRCQEVEDPNYDKQPMVVPTRATVATTSKGENLGCFGTSKKKKESAQQDQHAESTNAFASGSSKNSLPSGGGGGVGGNNGGPLKSYEHLWQPEVVQYYLALLQSCSNPETLEAAAGAIQNLSACYWQPSIDIRATVRKEKGLPILVELLRMEVDRVVCAVATALRNLAIDQRNKELIGKYAMRDLVQKLPSGNPQHDQSTSDDTISAVLATINEVIKKNPEFSRSVLDAGGVERLMNITRQRQKYTTCVLKFASQVLFTMWQHHELRDVYKKNGWKEQDFVTKYFVAHNAAPNSPNNANNTLNRPMASQSRTRYEDRTIQRVPNNAAASARTNGAAGGAGGGVGGAMAMCNEPNSMLCQMTDDAVNGFGEENYQRGAPNSSVAIFTDRYADR